MLRSIRSSIARATTAPPAAILRAGAASVTRAPTMPSPPAAAAADPTKMSGSSRCAACQAGVAVSARSTPVYEASAGARAAARSPAGRAPASRSRPAIGTRKGNSAAISAAPARPAIGPKPARIQVPTDIGDVGFAVRIMFRNRRGRPRSWTSATSPAAAAQSAPIRATRRRSGRFARSAPAARSDEPAASPPRNRYAGISVPHGAALTIGRP